MLVYVSAALYKVMDESYEIFRHQNKRQIDGFLLQSGSKSHLGINFHFL